MINTPLTPTDCVPSKLYWTDRGRIASISQSNLDGSERTVLVKKDVVWPHNIVVDIPNQRLYWVDSKLHTLETITTSGKDRRILNLSLIHISEPTRHIRISYAVFCL